MPHTSGPWGGGRPIGPFILLVALAAAAWAPTASAQRTYYVSATGDDGADGTATRPWASVVPVNALDLGPGDRVLFEGGQTFPGGLYLDAADAGTPAAPVVIGSYGAGRATLDAGAGTAVYVYNAGGVDVRDLVVRGAGVAANNGSGVLFYADLPGDVRLEHVRVERVEAYGFGQAAISIGSWNGRSGFRDVRVTEVEAHDSRDGMQTYAEAVGGIEDLYVGHSRFYENPGRPGAPKPTGSGLIVSGVRGALVERNVAFENGADNTNSAGPIGIWAYDADRVVVRHNESYANRTQGNDGGGFDLDGGVTNSVLEYNYAHDNDGAGYGLYQYAGALPSGGNVVRYNVSENDGRRGTQGAISVWGASASDRVGRADVYHNTVYVRPTGSAQPAAVHLLNRNYERVAFWNNLLFAAEGSPLVRGTGAAQFAGNAYVTGGAPFSIEWGGNSYGSLAAWRDGTGRERVAGEDVGVVTDSAVRAPGQGGTIGDADRLDELDAYRLEPGSVLEEAALDLESLFGVDTGAEDFYGAPLPPGGGRSIGAHESDPAGAPGTVAVGFAGTITLRQSGRADWHHVAFDRPYHDPVVVVGPPSFKGNQPTTVRVRNVTATGFDVRVDEWDYLDGRHVAEAVSYLVVEAGDHTIEAGPRLVAGRMTQASHRWRSVAFDQPFEETPVVLAQVVTDNGAPAVAPRLRSVTASGFSLVLQEQEANADPHPDEGVAYVALLPASAPGLWAGLAPGVSSAPTAIPFGVPVDSAPAVLAAMQTTRGGDPSALRITALGPSGVTVFVEEEASADSETAHTEETVGVLALAPGSVRAHMEGAASQMLAAGPPAASASEAETRLLGSVPNPFSSQTRIRYALAEPGPVSLVVFDIVGRRVAGVQSGDAEAGVHEVPFNGAALPAGTYIVRFCAGPVVDAGLLTIVR